MNKKILATTIISFVTLGVSLNAANAEELSTNDIVKALAPKKPLTRSLKPKSKMATSDRNFLKSLGDTRGIKFTVNKNAGEQITNENDYKEPTYEKEEIAKVVEITKQYNLPKLEFEINFELGSAVVSGDSLSSVINLSKALSHPSMADTKIILGGHTDAKGSEAFNQILSQKRSDSVAQLIVKIGNVNPDRIVPIGYGEHELKNKHDPLADENRRVEVINISSY